MWLDSLSADILNVIEFFSDASQKSIQFYIELFEIFSVVTF
jgi:hypothetical protein